MSVFKALPLCVALALVIPLVAGAADREGQESRGTGLRLQLSRNLDINAPSEKDESATYLTAFRMVGTPNEKVELFDDAEVRRGGAVLRGDKITYTFSSDEVHSKGNALVARNGTVFRGPELTYRLDAETGEMPDADFLYLPTQVRGTSEKIELLGNGKAQMCNAIITTCREGEEAW